MRGGNVFTGGVLRAARLTLKLGGETRFRVSIRDIISFGFGKKKDGFSIVDLTDWEEGWGEGEK